MQKAEVLPDLLAGLLIAKDSHALFLRQIDLAFQLRDLCFAEKLEDLQIEERLLQLEPKDESVEMPAPLDERSRRTLTGFVVFQGGNDERDDTEHDAAYLDPRHYCWYGVLVLSAIQAKIMSRSR